MIVGPGNMSRPKKNVQKPGCFIEREFHFETSDSSLMYTTDAQWLTPTHKKIIVRYFSIKALIQYKDAIKPV